MIETVFFYLILNLLVLLGIFPAGILIVQAFLQLNLKRASSELVISNGLFWSLSYCFGVIFLSLSSVFLLLSPLPEEVSRFALWITFVLPIALLSFYLFSSSKSLPKSLLSREIFLFYLLSQFAGMFFILLLCFPSGLIEEANTSTSMFLTGLPVDLLIPYNGSRYFLENLSPNDIEVVPTWNFSERGPLMALLNSWLFSILGLKENGLWLGASQGLFFTYQSFSIILNLQACFVLMLLTSEWFGLRAALFGLVSLLSCYFVSLNMMFAWPKFFMASFLLVSFWYYIENKKVIVPGVLSGVAMLLHDSAVFFIFSFIILIGILSLLEINFSKQFLSLDGIYYSIKRVLAFLLAFLLVLSPWLLLKKFYLINSPRLFYMHLFCYLEGDISKVSFSLLMNEYFINNSVLDILKIRLINLTYPFNLTEYIQAFSSGNSFFNSFFRIFHLQFFQIFASFGLPLVLIFILAILKREKSEKYKKALLLNLVSFSSVFFLALISGCGKNTVNHIWAYPAFLSFFLLVPAYVESVSSKNFTKGVVLLVFSIGVGLNIFASVAYYSYRSALKPFLHSSSSYLFGLCLIAALFFSVLFIFAFKKED